MRAGWPIVGLVFALGLSACSEATAPYPTFEVEGRWAGAFEVGVQLWQVSIEASVERCGGSIEAGTASGEIVRSDSIQTSYNPPVVVFQPCGRVTSVASFVGELHQPDLLQGSLFLEEVSDGVEVDLFLVSEAEERRR